MRRAPFQTLRFFPLGLALISATAGCSQNPAEPSVATAKSPATPRPSATVVPESSTQQITGESGSPSATSTIPGDQLPAPDPKFGGVIKDEALQSKPWWAPRIVPPSQAPNVLLIITDDKYHTAA